jgi:hypothetical protein
MPLSSPRAIEITSSTRINFAMAVAQAKPCFVFDGTLASPGPLTQVKQGESYGFFGYFDIDTLSKSAATFIAERSNGSLNDLTSTLSTFLTLAYNDCRETANPLDAPTIANACWLCIRICHPTDEFVEPRWHRDGRMFVCSCESQQQHSKYAVALLGPSTRVLHPSAEVDAAMSAVGDWYEGRTELARRLVGCPEIPVERRQVIRFSWGQENSPVHSEPDFSHDDRVFVSVLFGSEQEIRNMCEFRGEVFGQE